MRISDWSSDVCSSDLSVLVIASPSAQLLPGEQTIITDYVNHGGNVLWLADPDYPPGIEPLAKDLGVSWQNGYAIFPDYQLLGTGPPGFFAAIGYPPNVEIGRASCRERVCQYE